MDREEVTKWLSIMKANLNSFPEVSSGKKNEALGEAIRLLKNEQSEIPIGSDCVDRHAVDMLAYRYLKEPTDNHVAFYEDFLDLPSVTPIRSKGHWIDHSDEGYVECPKCGSATNCDGNINDLHFCFSCGAEMEGSEEI